MIRIFLLLGLVLGGSGDEPTLAAGRAALQERDFARAVEIFGALKTREPENGRAFYLYGYALHAKGDLAAAAVAHERAAEFEVVRADASYNAACARALLGETDKAFEWLNRAAKAGYRDVRAMLADKDLASLVGDKRFQALLPIGETATFLEELEVLRTHDGEAAGDRFGWIARHAGDVDGDGTSDVLTSAPFKSIGGGAAGRIYVYSGRTGKLLFTKDGKPGDQLGIGIDGAGDVDGDGHGDVMAGASGAGGTGAAYVYSGKDGALLHTLSGEAAGDNFGRKLACAGDQDGDGHDDLIVGAPTFDGVGTDSGRAYVFSGKTGKPLIVLDGERADDRFGSTVDGYSKAGLQLLVIGERNAGPGQRGRVSVYRVTDGTAKLAFRIESAPGDANLGQMFVSAVGDVNGDGVVDIYGSDWGSSASGKNSSGRIYVHSGADGKRLHTLDGTSAGECFGIGTAEAGDQDGDGCDDLLIGSWLADDGAPDAGKCGLYSGKTGKLLRTFTCSTPGDTFGYDATALGDWNGDGIPELLITSAESLVKGPASGRLFVIAGGVR